jgi:multidrug resistance efflux pump
MSLGKKIEQLLKEHIETQIQKRNKEILEENDKLRFINNDLKKQVRLFKLREALYQSELNKIKNKLSELYKNVSPTPHSHSEEYKRIASEIEREENVKS